MKLLATTVLFILFQTNTTTIVKNNGDEIRLRDMMMYQSNEKTSNEQIHYLIRGKQEQIKLSEVRRISFKETVQKKKGITTYRAILVKSNNDKLNVEIDLVKVEGLTEDGQMESLSFSTVDKISF